MNPRSWKWFKIAAVMIAICWAGGSISIAADWTQFRGPTHDGVVPAAEKLTGWPEAGPKVLWKIPLGEGYSGIVIAKGRCFTMVERDKQEFLIRLDPETGKELWAKLIDKTVFDKQGNGPRSTPALDGDYVYITSSQQKLLCLKAEDGEPVWSHDIRKEYKGQGDNWGFASSPVIDDDKIFLCAGGKGQSLLAFNKTTGELAWKGQDDKITHASPTPATIHGVRQIIFHTASGLVSVAPADGQVLWRFEYKHTIASPSSPVVGGDFVYVSAEYGIGAGACKVNKTDAGFTAAPAWRRPGELENHWSTPAFKDGYIYGLYPKPNTLRCVDIATGKDVWQQTGFSNFGTIVIVGDNLLVQNSTGTLILVKASPDACNEIARIQLLGGKSWAVPALSNGRLYIRSTKEGMCLDVSSPPTP